MKSLRLYFGFALFACLFFGIVKAEQQIQHPLIEEVEPALEPVADIVPITDDAPEEPVPPPIWTLCGNPSEHLLIPYPSPYPSPLPSMLTYGLVTKMELQSSQRNRWSEKTSP